MTKRMVAGCDPADLAIGTAIRARRQKMRLSQQALGERIGVTYQQIQKYELGHNRVSASGLLRIAEALSTNATSFLPDEPPTSQRDAALVAFAQDPANGPMAEAWLRLTSFKRDEIRALILALAARR